MENYFDYKEKRYPCKRIYFPKDDNYYTISVESLEKILIPNDGTYDSDTARFIDEQIFFFVPDDMLCGRESMIAQFVENNL